MRAAMTDLRHAVVQGAYRALRTACTEAIAELDAEHYESQVGGCSVCLPSRSWPCVTRQVADDLRAALGEGE